MLKFPCLGANYKKTTSLPWQLNTCQGIRGTVGHTAVRAQWDTRQSGHSGTHGSQGAVGHTAVRAQWDTAVGAQWDTRQLGHSGTHGNRGTVAHTAVGAQWHTWQQATTINSQKTLTVVLVTCNFGSTGSHRFKIMDKIENACRMKCIMVSIALRQLGRTLTILQTLVITQINVHKTKMTAL